MSKLQVLYEERNRAHAAFVAARDSGADRATKRRLWEQYEKAYETLDDEWPHCPECGQPMPLSSLNLQKERAQ